MAERRALLNLEFPKWDGKLVLAGMFFIGYYGLVFTMSSRALPEANIEIVRDAMLTLGPPIGVIVGALFRSTGAEERRDALRSNELQTAIVTPSVVAPTPNSIAPDVEEGARRGTREGVEEALADVAPDEPTSSYDPADDIDFNAEVDAPVNVKGA